jgi:hypothetical protein
MRLLRLALVLLAALAAIVPLPARLVEAWYSQGLYPAIQARLTPLSNQVSIALLDVSAAVLLLILFAAFVSRVKVAGFLRGSLRTLLTIVTLTAALYLLFLAVWGLNYRRVPLEAKLVFDESRITRDAAFALGEYAVAQVNAMYAPARSAVPEGPTLEEAFASAQQTLGSRRFAVPGLPKRSLLELYFRWAAIDGMTNPYFLEVIINPDALAFERPFIMSHEWAHLAGHAHEAEANFLAWLTCTRGNALARYSGWFAIYEHVAGAMSKADRTALAAQLDPGPRQDLQEASKRYLRSSPVVRNTTREVYDTYLRANRVNEGIASYSAVVRLMLGADILAEGAPRMR